eukprot:51938-Hanusia_phi.AAC.1
MAEAPQGPPKDFPGGIHAGDEVGATVSARVHSGSQVQDKPARGRDERAARHNSAEEVEETTNGRLFYCSQPRSLAPGLPRLALESPDHQQAFRCVGSSRSQAGAHLRVTSIAHSTRLQLLQPAKVSSHLLLVHSRILRCSFQGPWMLLSRDS